MVLHVPLQGVGAVMLGLLAQLALWPQSLSSPPLIPSTPAEETEGFHSC